MNRAAPMRAHGQNLTPEFQNMFAIPARLAETMPVLTGRGGLPPRTGSLQCRLFDDNQAAMRLNIQKWDILFP
jgi:hypothetical protein